MIIIINDLNFLNSGKLTEQIEALSKNIKVKSFKESYEKEIIIFGKDKGLKYTNLTKEQIETIKKSTS